jgi:hypothetical protein
MTAENRTMSTATEDDIIIEDEIGMGIVWLLLLVELSNIPEEHR